MKTKTIKLDLTKQLGLDISKKAVTIIAIFIPHKGCKNCCVFCNQKRISGELKDVTSDDVRIIIDEQLKHIKTNNPKQVAFFGGSFTGLELNEQEAFLKVANEYIVEGKVQSIRISTRPDYISDKILALLKQYNVKTIELGVQSMSPECLDASKRGHTPQDVILASKKIKRFGFELGHQMMVGLPKSSEGTELYTIHQLLKLHPNILRIYPVYVLKQSELYDMMVQKKYIPPTLEEALLRSESVYKECIKAKLNVIRVGLQTTEEISTSSKDIYGPVCDNYRERILSHIAKEQVCQRLNKLSKYDKICIQVPLKQINYVVGNNRENVKEYLKYGNISIKCK